MTPFGYRIVNAEAVVDPDEAGKLKRFFERFIECGQFKASAEDAGIMKAHTTYKKMLSNRVYLGTDYYPRIIEPEMFEKAQEMLKKVGWKKKSGRLIPDLPVYTGFVVCAGEADPKEMDPKEYAIRQFERIRAVW